LKNVKPFQKNIILDIREVLLEKKVKDHQISFVFRNSLPSWVFNPPAQSTSDQTNDIKSSPDRSDSPAYADLTSDQIIKRKIPISFPTSTDTDNLSQERPFKTPRLENSPPLR